MNTIKAILQSNLIYIKLALVAIVAAMLWWYFKPNPQPVGTPTQAVTAPQLSHTLTETIKPAHVHVYRQDAKKKVPLPSDVASNPDLHVIASSKVPISQNPQNITSVINERTGEISTYVSREPLPWLRAEQTGEARIDYGWNGNSNVARLSVREDLLQVKALHAGLNGSLESDGHYFIGAGIGYRW